MHLTHAPDLVQVRFCGGHAPPLALPPLSRCLWNSGLYDLYWPVIGLSACTVSKFGYHECCKHSILHDSHTSLALSPVRQSSGMKCLSLTLRSSCSVWRMMRKGWRHLLKCLEARGKASIQCKKWTQKLVWWRFSRRALHVQTVGVRFPPLILCHNKSLGSNLFLPGEWSLSYTTP